MTNAVRALVTGAASGIGLATARGLLERGAVVMAVDEDSDRLRRSLGNSPATLMTVDVNDARAVRACFAVAESAFGGPVETLVHSAGKYEIAATHELDPADWRRLLDINATGTFLVAREFGRRLIAAGNPGAAVLLTSIAADHGDDAEPAAHYSASKAAVVALTRQLAVEWGPYGIRINAVSPGLIRTPMLRITDDEQRARRAVDAVVPLRRLGESHEVASACLFLAGAEAAYVSGTVVTVDGGLTAR